MSQHPPPIAEGFASADGTQPQPLFAGPSNPGRTSRRFLPRLPSSRLKPTATEEDIAEFDRLKAEATASGGGAQQPLFAGPSNAARTSRRFLPRLPSTRFNSTATAEDIAEFDRLKAAQGAQGAATTTSEQPFSFFGSEPAKRAGPRLPSAAYQPVSDEAHAAFARQQEEAAAKTKQPRQQRGFGSRLPSMARSKSPSGRQLQPHQHQDAEASVFDRVQGTNQSGNRSSAQFFSQHGRLGESFSHSLQHLPTSKSLAHLPSLAHIHTREEEDAIKELERSQPQAPVMKFKTVRERVVYEIRHRHACERAIMACFAVCLLWLTSLAVAQSIVYNLIVGPSLELVMQDVDYAVNATTLQRLSYASCANRTVDGCEDNFEFFLALETDKSQHVLDQNRALLDEYNSVRGECADNFANTVLLMDYLTTVLNLQFDPQFAVGNFSRPQCASVAQTLKDQMAAIRAHTTAEQFHAQADQVMLGLYDQYRARAAYDRAYVGNQSSALGLTGDALNAMVADPRGYFRNMTSGKNQMYACMSANGTAGEEECEGTPLLKKLADARNQFVNAYDQSVQSTRQYYNEVVITYTPLQTFYAKFSDLLRSIAGLRDQLNGAVADNGEGSGGIDGMGYSDNQPALGSLPAFISGSQFGSVIGGGMDAIAARATGKQQGSDQATADQMNADEETTKAAQRSWQQQFFSDYNPPPYDADSAEADWKATSSAFLPELSATLKVVATRVSPPEESETYESTLDSTASENVAKELLKTPEVTPLSFFAYDNISPDVMLGDWNYITDLALYLDYTYRILHSIAIIRSYWRISSVLVPPADVRVGSVPRGQTGRTRLTPDQMLAYIVTHPAFLVGIVVIFLAIICSMFLALYVPLFDEYVFGCVNGNADGQGYMRNGTMITRNAYTVAVEYASGPGDSIWGSGIDRINVQRELMCSKNEDWTYQQQRVDRQEYNFHSTKYADLLANVNTFRACVDVDEMDAVLTQADVLAATNGTRFTRSSLFNATCSAAMAPLDPYMFVCNNIPRCSGNCQGTTRDEFDASIYSAGCNLEYYMHAGVLGTAFSALAFILMNLSRCTVLRGLRRVFMRYFAQAEYSYLGTTSEVGEIEYPDAVAKEGQSFKVFVMFELHETIKSFERVGYFIVAFGLCLNVPWVVGLISFSNNLKFNALVGGDDTTTAP